MKADHRFLQKCDKDYTSDIQTVIILTVGRISVKVENSQYSKAFLKATENLANPEVNKHTKKCLRSYHNVLINAQKRISCDVQYYYALWCCSLSKTLCKLMLCQLIK